MQNRAFKWVRMGLGVMRAAMPFPLCHLHPDNGSEFINYGLVGYARYSTQEMLSTLNELYAVHGLLLNYFYPSQKLILKSRVGSKVRKTYDHPQSPADRLLGHPAVEECRKDVQQAGGL